MKYFLTVLLIISVFAQDEDPYWGQSIKEMDFNSKIAGLKLSFLKKGLTKPLDLEFTITYPALYQPLTRYSFFYNGFNKEVTSQNINTIYFGGKDSFLINFLNTDFEKMEFNICPVSHNGVIRDDSLWLSTDDYKLASVGVGVHGQSEFKLTTGSGYGTNALRHYIMFNNKRVDISDDLSEGKFPIAVIKANKFYKEFEVENLIFNSLTYEILGETLNSIGVHHKYLISDEYIITEVSQPESTFNFNSNVYTFLDGKCLKVRRNPKKSHLRKDLKEIKIPEKVTN